MILATHFKHLNALNWFNVSIQFFFFSERNLSSDQSFLTYSQSEKWITFDFDRIYEVSKISASFSATEMKHVNVWRTDLQYCFYSLWWYKYLIFKVGWCCNALSLLAMKSTENFDFYKQFLKFIKIVLLLLRISNSYWYFYCCY